MTVMMSDTDINVYLVALTQLIMSNILSVQAKIVYEIIRKPMVLRFFTLKAFRQVIYLKNMTFYVKQKFLEKNQELQIQIQIYLRIYLVISIKSFPVRFFCLIDLFFFHSTLVCLTEKFNITILGCTYILLIFKLTKL